MTAYINKIKSKAGDQQLPVNYERAVRDDNSTAWVDATGASV